MDSAYLLIGLSLAVLISYGFDLFSSRIKTPSVILLLLLGIITRWISGYFDVQISFVAPALSALLVLSQIAYAVGYISERWRNRSPMPVIVRAEPAGPA